MKVHILIDWLVFHYEYMMFCNKIFQACCILNLMKYIQKLQDKGVKCGAEVVALFAGELNPVAPKAQKKVPVPEG